jgi:hypothetical protein
VRKKATLEVENSQAAALDPASRSDSVARPDKDDAIKRKRRRSPPKRRSTDPAAPPPAAPDNEAIKVVPAVWVESPSLSPSLIALNTPARGQKPPTCATSSTHPR